MLWQVKKDRPLPCIPVMPLAGELFLLSFHCLPFQNAHGLGFDILLSEAAAQCIELGNNSTCVPSLIIAIGSYVFTSGLPEAENCNSVAVMLTSSNSMPAESSARSK